MLSKRNQKLKILTVKLWPCSLLITKAMQKNANERKYITFDEI